MIWQGLLLEEGSSMANPQLEDGYLKIANTIVDNLISVNLSSQELRAALFVIRKTYGYNKKWDKISLSQFQKAINVRSKSQMSGVINSLLFRKILTVQENLNGQVKEYRFNKDFEAWRTVHKNLNGVQEKVNHKRHCLKTRSKDLKPSPHPIPNTEGEPKTLKPQPTFVNPNSEEEDWDVPF